MIFRRRNPAGWWSQIREAFYPRKGWRRGFDYLVQRVRRVPDSPHRIALGFACGTFVSFSPFYTLHIPLTLGLAWLTRASLIGGFIGTFVGNFMTTPFIALGAIATGNLVLGRQVSTGSFAEIASAFGEAFGGLWQIAKSFFGYGEAAPERLLPFFHEVFLPYMIGGAILGVPAGLAAYWLSRGAVAAYQARRRGRLMALARDKVRAGLAKASQAGLRKPGATGPEAAE